MVDVIGLAGVGLSALSLLFGILALALTLWMSGKVNGADGTVGLWEFCVDSTCTKFEDVANLPNEDEYKVVRAMLFLAIFLLVGAIVCAILKMFVMKDMEILPLVAGALALVAGLFMMIGFAVYADKIADTDTYDYDAAFALDIVGWILSWVAGGLFIASKFMTKKA